MEKYVQELIDDARNQSRKNETIISKSKQCGCYYCKTVFDSITIEEWTDEDLEERTALCPNCGVDAVIPDSFPIINKDFLKALHEVAFESVTYCLPKSE